MLKDHQITFERLAFKNMAAGENFVEALQLVLFGRARRTHTHTRYTSVDADTDWLVDGVKSHDFFYVVPSLLGIII